jgi:hypothetical protein
VRQGLGADASGWTPGPQRPRPVVSELLTGERPTNQAGSAIAQCRCGAIAEHGAAQQRVGTVTAELVNASLNTGSDKTRPRDSGPRHAWPGPRPSRSAGSPQNTRNRPLPVNDDQQQPTESFRTSSTELLAIVQVVRLPRFALLEFITNAVLPTPGPVGGRLGLVSCSSRPAPRAACLQAGESLGALSGHTEGTKDWQPPRIGGIR